MNILVTGGAGYIGSITAKVLLEAGHSVIVYDNLCHGYRAAVPKGATFVLGDLHDRAALDAAFEECKPEAVMHFAAFIEAGESMREPGRFFHNNVAGVDLAQAHLLALDALESREALTYNLGNGAGYSVREVIEVARQVTGHPIPTVEAPRRPGDAPRLVASSEAIRRDLGWTPRYPDLRQIVESAWEWQRAHPNGYA
jgi:UDP-glucose 4-epimerase